MLGAVILLWKKLEEAKEELERVKKEANHNLEWYCREEKKYKALKNKYDKLSTESRLINKKMEMMNYSNTKIRVSHLRDILSLKIKQDFPGNFIEKNKDAQKLLDRNLQRFSCATDTSLSIFDGNNQYVNILITDYQSRIITPILNELKTPLDIFKKPMLKRNRRKLT